MIADSFHWSIGAVCWFLSFVGTWGERVVHRWQKVYFKLFLNRRLVVGSRALEIRFRGRDRMDCSRSECVISEVTWVFLQILLLSTAMIWIAHIVVETLAVWTTTKLLRHKFWILGAIHDFRTLFSFLCRQILLRTLHIIIHVEIPRLLLLLLPAAATSEDTLCLIHLLRGLHRRDELSWSLSHGLARHLWQMMCQFRWSAVRRGLSHRNLHKLWDAVIFIAICIQV